MSTTVTTMPTSEEHDPIFRKVQTEANAPQLDDKKKKKRGFSMRKMMSKIKNKSSRRKLDKSPTTDFADNTAEPTKQVLGAKAETETAVPTLKSVATDDEVSSASSHSSENAVHPSDGEEETEEATTPPETTSVNEMTEVVAVEEFVPVIEEEETKSEVEEEPVKKTINYTIEDEEYAEQKEPEKTPITSSDAIEEEPVEKTIKYAIDDEEYVEQKEPEKAPITSSDAIEEEPVKKTINYAIDDEEYVEEKEPEKTPITSSDAMALLLAGALIAAQAFS